MYLDSLNELQFEAVKESDGYIRVIAGAGTGKTKVLTARYLYLLESKHLEPDDILCMTFTRKAMNEMKDRIRSELNAEKRLKYIITYHSFGSLFLREEITVLGYNKFFRILDEEALRGILTKICSKHNLELTDTEFQEIKDYISYIKRTSGYVSRIMNHDYPNNILLEIRTLYDKIADDYLLYQRKTRCLDFDDLILFTHYILKNYPDIASKWQDKFKYIEVDEGQDTSIIENEIIEILASKNTNLFIVGDPDQNIYEWRESDNRILVNFDKTHKDCKTFILKENYRSTQNILYLADKLISHNKVRIKKEIVALNGAGTEIVYKRCSSSYDSNEDIIADIKDKHEHGVLYKDIAILYRCRFLIDDLIYQLKEASIPYIIIGEQSFYTTVEIQDMIALIKLVLFEDDQAFIRMINKPSRKFGKKKLEYLISLQHKDSLYRTLRKNRNDQTFASCDVFTYLDNIECIKENLTKKDLKSILTDLYINTGYQDYLSKLKNENKRKNVLTFLSSIEEYANENKERTLEEYYHLYLEDVDESKNADAILLMSIHASKGLEFKNVYILGLNEDVLPHKKAIEDRGEKGLEEERRLFYVAITRAREYLYISSYQANKNSVESRFIKEAFE